MPWGLSPIHVIAAIGIILVLVGPGRLPGLGSLLGRRVREFGSAAADTKDSFLGEVQAPKPVDGVAGDESADAS